MSVFEWCHDFKERRISVECDELPGKPFASSVAETVEKICILAEINKNLPIRWDLWWVGYFCEVMSSYYYRRFGDETWYNRVPSMDSLHVTSIRFLWSKETFIFVGFPFLNLWATAVASSDSEGHNCWFVKSELLRV